MLSNLARYSALGTRPTGCKPLQITAVTRSSSGALIASVDGLRVQIGSFCPFAPSRSAVRLCTRGEGAGGSRDPRVLLRNRPGL